VLAPFPVPLGYDVTRDDGQVIRFSGVTNANGDFLAPAGTTLRLRAVAGGYRVTDQNDTTELYGSSGRLLLITSRSGVTNTMSYDSLGRLSTVTDSFGHQLVFVYDTQNRLISVTRQ
jgi:YD repeat-containing protein